MGAAQKKLRRKAAKKRILTIKQILTWAKAHHGRTGCYPQAQSGPVVGAKKENWLAINDALWRGYRGLSGGTTLSRLLNKRTR